MVSRIVMAGLVLIVPATAPLPAPISGTWRAAAGCGVLTGLAAREIPAPKTHIDRYYLESQGSTILTQNAMPVKDNAPVTKLQGVVQYRGRMPEPSPVLTIQVHVVDTTERSIDQRQLVLMLDDSVRMEFGSMRVFLLSKPNIPSHPFELLTYARRATILLGDTEVKLSQSHLDGLRTLYVAAVCGG